MNKAPQVGRVGKSYVSANFCHSGEFLMLNVADALKHLYII